MTSSIASLDLCTLADAIAAGEITSVAATTLTLDRLDTVGRKLNAVVRLDATRALEAADAADRKRASGATLPPLHGVPLAHKDLFYRAGDLSAGGSKIRTDFRADTTATVIDRLDAAGALDLGRLQLAEFALSPTGYNEHNGHALNPWNPAHVPGGSSSGSGVAVAARLVAGSLGTDTGGSLRHPGAMCGLVGLKPTWGLVPTDGVMPLSASLDCTGPLARNARDAARLLSVITAGDYESALGDGVSGMTIAIPGGYYRELLQPAIAVRLEQAVVAMRRLGVTTIETAPPDMAVVNALMHLMMSVEAATIHRRWLIERPQDYSDQVRSRIEPGLFYPATRYVEALSLRAQITQGWIASCIGRADLALLPAISIPVPTIAATTEGDPADVARVIGQLTHCTRGINYLGLPAASVPCGFDCEGLPVAFQLVGRPYAEATILRTIHAYQGVTDWHQRVPDAAELN
ncbi:amidase [Tardiphaga sp. vice304]|uniref:amidase n=1 Tax=unclassified Tardiphaga TaxID=2631404 RepID=UPI001163C2C1|nr:MULTISPECIES: amidase [unclassified Tardiphaga]QDM18926.1 amidase [Tardiphaga sp. vice278]QDM23911.1 amidase [Tardiphaga sp. vice154]QDM29132.1 amidase [Tardiphaga sp. vice304]